MAFDKELIGHATELALINFEVSGRPSPIGIVHALARVKSAMASANSRFPDLTGIDDELAAAIIASATEVADGRWDDQLGLTSSKPAPARRPT